MNQNILFINPPNYPFTSSGILIEPIDTLGLATFTQSLGHTTRVLDMDVKRLHASDLSETLQYDLPSIIIIVFDYHIPLHDVGANDEINQICLWAKSQGIKTILGGKAATFENHEINIEADIFVSYEMENVLAQLLMLDIKNWNNELIGIAGIRYRTDDKPLYIKTVSRDEKVVLDNLPIANRSLVDIEDYIDVRTILSSRGCNLQCTFCHVPGFWGFWRARNATLVADEIELLVKNYNAQKILFLDDNATVKPSRMDDISDLLIQRDIKVALGCLGTIDRYKPNTIEKMYNAGFRWIHYGAESGDDAQLLSMGKRIDSHKIFNTVKATQNAGLRVRTSWIMDMPELTLDGLLKTEDLILKTASDEIRLHFLTLRLGSILHEKNAHLITPQFIHNSKQNLNISGVDSEKIIESVNRILRQLVNMGYVVVKNAEDFKDVEKLKQQSENLKIVSLCPLRYGLGWKY